MSNQEVVFERQVRYVVFKIKDILEFGEERDLDILRQIGGDIAYRRRLAGKPIFNAVVVEQDWPEFDVVWKLIEERMLGRQETLIGGLKPHKVRDMVNELRLMAEFYYDHQSLRERISHVVHDYLEGKK